MHNVCMHVHTCMHKEARAHHHTWSAEPAQETMMWALKVLQVCACVGRNT